MYSNQAVSIEPSTPKKVTHLVQANQFAANLLLYCNITTGSAIITYQEGTPVLQYDELISICNQPGLQRPVPAPIPIPNYS